MTRPMLRSVLAATDLRDGSEAVVRAAAQVARDAGARLHLLHSVRIPVERWQALQTQERVRQGAEALSLLARRALPEGMSAASQHVDTCPPCEAVLDRAHAVAADLIVLGATHRGAARAHLLGTTTDRVIRVTGVPCLVVCGPLSLPLRRIGVPTDLSEAAQRALEVAVDWGRELALGRGDGRLPEIHLVHVGWPVNYVDHPELEDEVIRPALEEQVRAALGRPEGWPTLEVTTDVLWKNTPSRSLVEWVSREKIDLLVVGTKGTGGLRRALLGSITSFLAREAPCPVLVVNAGAHEPREEEPRRADTADEREAAAGSRRTDRQRASPRWITSRPAAAGAHPPGKRRPGSAPPTTWFGSLRQLVRSTWEGGDPAVRRGGGQGKP